MSISGQNTAGQKVPRYGGDVRISEDEWVKDERTGEMRLSERGITRQKEDITRKAEQLGVDLAEWYPENDTTAFKKRRIHLPDGRSVWRVYRPEFRRMLRDYEDGKIDGIIFYDIDRLARQPRDLEDLIDLVEHYKRPVETVTGNIDLRTSNGRAMARVLVAMANKSSEDTARRVARARLQIAQEGKATRFRGLHRRFGYTREGKVVAEEKAVIREAMRKFMAGETWSGVVRYFVESGVSTTSGGRWLISTVQQILLSPSVAGIAVYNGSLREANQKGTKKNFRADPEGIALKDAAGRYIIAGREPILTVDEWKALVAEQDARKKGYTFSARGTRKYLLTGLLRCGRIREDGTVCNRSLIGVPQKYGSGKIVLVYRCPQKVQGGCGGTQRNMEKLDALIEDLLFAQITRNTSGTVPVSAEPDAGDPDAVLLAETQESIRKLRMGYAAVPKTVSDDTMFTVLPRLEATERDLKSRLSKKAKARIGQISRAKSPEDVRREWDESAGNVGVRRAILSRYLKAVIVRKSATVGGAPFDYLSIEPVWREEGDYAPHDDLAL
jgi:DNA invertase Pin-like site-specific DNA recombinase